MADGRLALAPVRDLRRSDEERRVERLNADAPHAHAVGAGCHVAPPKMAVGTANGSVSPSVIRLEGRGARESAAVTRPSMTTAATGVAWACASCAGSSSGCGRSAVSSTGGTDAGATPVPGHGKSAEPER